MATDPAHPAAAELAYLVSVRERANTARAEHAAAENAAAERAYAAGATMRDIAEALGLSLNGAAKMVRRSGATVRPIGRQRFVGRPQA